MKTDSAVQRIMTRGSVVQWDGLPWPTPCPTSMSINVYVLKGVYMIDIHNKTHLYLTSERAQYLVV